MGYEQAGEANDRHYTACAHMAVAGCDVYCSIGYLSCESFHCYLSICLPITKMTKDSTEAIANPVCGHIFDILPPTGAVLQIDRKIRPLPYIGVGLCQNAPCSRPKAKFMVREFHFSCKKRVPWGCFSLIRLLQPTRYPESPDVRWWVVSGMGNRGSFIIYFIDIQRSMYRQ
jgi:hypothetical protein